MTDFTNFFFMKFRLTTPGGTYMFRPTQGTGGSRFRLDAVDDLGGDKNLAKAPDATVALG